jgi:hypothetical protein
MVKTTKQLVKTLNNLEVAFEKPFIEIPKWAVAIGSEGEFLSKEQLNDTLEYLKYKGIK